MFFLFTIFTLIYFLNLIWINKAKQIILNDLPSNIEIIKKTKNINIKYSPTKRNAKNININLLEFINDMLLLNTPNKEKAFYYLSNGYSRKPSIKLEDELIIDLQDQELNNLNFEIIEIFLEDK